MGPKCYPFPILLICTHSSTRHLLGTTVYMNFGVFELYGDRALSDALDIILRMLLSILLPDMLAYRKLLLAVLGTSDCPDVFPEILRTLFEIVLFEDCGNQCSLSRPMLSLILLSEEKQDDQSQWDTSA